MNTIKPKSPLRPQQPKAQPQTSFIGKIFEKILIAGATYFVLLFLSFSFFTGKFPPNKEDISKVTTLVKRMVFDVREGQAQAQTLTEMVENGETPSLEQVAEFQRLSLKRTELALELLAIFKRVNISQEINPEMQEILMKVSGHLEDADEQLGKIAQHFQKAQSPSE